MGRFSLDGKIAIVTGVLGLLGSVWSEALLEAGATVIGIDLQTANISERFKELQKKFGRKKIGLYRANILKKDQLEKVLKACKKDFGIPTILVNNAGIDQPPSEKPKNYYLEDIPIEVGRKILEVNLLGTFLVTQVFGKEMKKIKRGSIINIGSQYALISPDPHFYDHIKTNPPFLKPVMYGPSKRAVISLSERMAVEWGKFGIRVNTISPGGIYNPLNPQDKKFIKKFNARVPLGRMGIDEDLKGPLIFLASEASKYITGFNLKVDGGFTIL